MAYGATRAEWDHFAAWLGIEADLLPVVSNPTAPINIHSSLGTPARDGRLPKPGKVPSLYNAEREVVGLPRWTQMQVSARAIREWAQEPDYGICIQTRTLRAIDVDVPNPILADEIRQEIADFLGVALPERYRPDTGKFLQVFEFDSEVLWPKRRLPVNGGVIEFLGDGQQFIACGTHPDGAKYAWRGGLPRDVPKVSSEKIEKLWDWLSVCLGTGEGKIARLAGTRERLITGIDDPRYDWLVDNWEIYDTGPDGQLFLRCPFDAEHSTDSTASSTAYFPAGVGGYKDETGQTVPYQRGHWRCLHAHCEGRDDTDFDHQTGYAVANFPNLPAIVASDDDSGDVERGDRGYPVPQVHPPRDGQGRAKLTMHWLTNSLADPGSVEMWLAYDTFLDQIVWADGKDHVRAPKWMAFSDDTYVRLRLSLERRGLFDIGKETLRETVLYAAKHNPIDSAMEWLKRLVWDGKPRIDTFFPRFFNTDDNAYTRAVSAYTWTAFAGRVMSPGCQVDMVPVLISEQGARKSSAIAALAPAESAYVKINLASRDDDLSRKLRGKLVGEFDELRGLNSRDSEDIKAWLTQRREEWVPKFKEFGTSFARRLLFIASGNRKAILADATGERRWLPMSMNEGWKVPVEQIIEVRDQLWAEGLTRWRDTGVAWQDAERLAVEFHDAYKVRDVWKPVVDLWLQTKVSNLGHETNRTHPFTIIDIICGALGLPPGQASQGHAARIERILIELGYEEHEPGKWSHPVFTLVK